ncbi:ribonuclease H-like domain-containing protein [Tanacetum coccineum]
MVCEHLTVMKISNHGRKRYFDVDLKSESLVKSVAAKMAVPRFVYPHTMGRGGYALVKEKMIKKKKFNHEKPARGTLWLKGRVNKDGEYPDDKIRSVGDKLVSLVDINPINSSADEEGGTTVVGCENDGSDSDV